MKVHFETAPKEYVQLELNDDILNAIPGGPAFGVEQLEHAFSLACRVPDVWRYTLKVRRGELPTMLPVTADPAILSRYADRSAMDALKFKRDHRQPKNAAAVRVLLLLLESPHVEEYGLDKHGRMVPLAPAQNDGLFGAGYGIDRCWLTAINPLELTEGDYLVIIANPVPYQCSLATVMPGTHLDLTTEPVKKVRDHVWETLFTLESVKRNFHERWLSYQPDIVLNCCTKALHVQVTEAIRGVFRKDSPDYAAAGQPGLSDIAPQLYGTSHPARSWLSSKYRGILVTKWPIPDGEPERLPRKTMPRPKILDKPVRRK